MQGCVPCGARAREKVRGAPGQITGQRDPEHSIGSVEQDLPESVKVSTARKSESACRVAPFFGPLARQASVPYHDQPRRWPVWEGDGRLARRRGQETMVIRGERGGNERVLITKWEGEREERGGCVREGETGET